jgi:hypothetical protein
MQKFHCLTGPQLSVVEHLTTVHFGFWRAFSEMSAGTRSFLNIAEQVWMKLNIV